MATCELSPQTAEITTTIKKKGQFTNSDSFSHVDQ